MVTEVSVEWQDIENGEARNCFRCAVANAIHRVTGDKFSIAVNPYGGMFAREEDLGIFIAPRHQRAFDGVRIPCPPEVIEFAQVFDSWKEFSELDAEGKDDWRGEHGHEDDYEPSEPWEFSFQVDIPNAEAT